MAIHAASEQAQGNRRGRKYTGRRQRSRQQSSMVSEINVTPFVDVMLVLLIIFMVSAPLLNTAIPVELPETAATSTASDETPLTITVNAEGKIYLHESEYSLATLAEKLTELARDGTDRTVYLRGDKSSSFGRVSEVLGLLMQAGFTKITFPTLPNGA